MVVCLISLNVLTVTVREVSSQQKILLNWQGIQETQNIVLRWKNWFLYLTSIVPSAIEKADFFKRILFCYVTGNEDMHLKNFSLITKMVKQHSPCMILKFDHSD
jgi:hypothetical protein